MKLSRRPHVPHPAAVRAAAVAAIVLSHPAAWAADDEPTATPYRPTVAGGASMSRPGWLELEFGVQRLGGNGTTRRDSLPYLLKYAFSEDWGLLLGGEAQVRLTPDGGNRLRGVGDTSVTLKYRVLGGTPGTAFGVEAGVKLPTAVDGLGSGQRDHSLKGICSLDVDAGWHVDVNLGATRFGAVDAGLGRHQLAWAAGVSHPLGTAWSLATDLSGTAQRGAASSAQWLVGASYSVSKRVVMDAGVARGLTSASPQWTLFSGVTVLLGQIF